MRIRVTESSATAPDVLWEALSDVASWPHWCRAFAAVQPDGPLAVGTGVRVVQPGMRAAVWRVDRVVAGRSFRWASRGPGFTMTTEHAVQPAGRGSTVTLSMTASGPMAWAVTLIAGRAHRRYLQQQARALAARPNPAA